MTKIILILLTSMELFRYFHLISRWNWFAFQQLWNDYDDDNNDGERDISVDSKKKKKKTKKNKCAALAFQVVLFLTA